MNEMMDRASLRNSDPLRECFEVDLTRADMALIIEALLQAEMTLPLLDQRFAALQPVESLRQQQLSLADRLEDIMAGTCRWQDHARVQPEWTSQRRREQP